MYTYNRLHAVSSIRVPFRLQLLPRLHPEEVVTLTLFLRLIIPIISLLQLEISPLFNVKMVGRLRTCSPRRVFRFRNMN